MAHVLVAPSLNFLCTQIALQQIYNIFKQEFLIVYQTIVSIKLAQAKWQIPSPLVNRIRSFQ